VDTQYHTLEECRPTPHVLDDYRVGRVVEVYSVQRDDVPLYGEQLRRWRALSLTPTEREEVDRLSAQILRISVKIAAILELAGKLKRGTIEAVLGKSDFEMGYEAVMRGRQEKDETEPPISGFTPEQIKTAAELDDEVVGFLRAGCDDVTLLAGMVEYMPKVKWLLDTAGKQGLDGLWQRFDWLYHYAKLVECIADGIASGEIEVPE
jgi:DNA-binding CsgD family transcriptional regulator